VSAAPPDHLEIELKIAIAEADAPRLARLPLIRQRTAGRASTRAMHSIYLDTPDRALQDAGAALRLRREGKRWVQTIKFGGSVEGGLHSRHEIEAQIAGPVLDRQALDHPALAPLLREAPLREALAPVFTADFRRTTRRLELAPGTTVELCVDLGELAAGERREPIREIELELESGSAAVLLDFADALLREIPGRLEPASKAERGYVLALGRAPAPLRAGPIRLQDDAGLERAFRAVVFGCVRQLQGNEPGVIGGTDPEYLHQARVALRRLRSAFAVFDAAFPRTAYAALIDELRWLGGCLGPARDWDVFVLSTLPALLRAFPDDAGLAMLARHATQLREQTGAIARQALSSTRHARMLLALSALFVHRPWEALDDAGSLAARSMEIRQFVAQVLARRHRKVVKRARRHADLDHAGLHALRIEVKKLRYAAEFAAGLYERKAVRAYVDALARLQEVLGGLNDAATVERLCHALRAAAVQERVDESIGLLRGWAGAIAEEHLSALPRAWKRFGDAEGFW